MTNLVTNALKFTESGGRIDVAMTRRDGVIRVSVRDDGAGIEPGLQDSVFEPFRTGDPLAGGRGGGIGLGLAIVREIVEAHGGRVGAESAGPAQGSTFWFELPVVSG